MTTEDKIIDAKEFSSMLLSCQLAAQFNSDKPNKAIKHTLKCVMERVTSERIKSVCKQGLNQMYPLGWVERQLNNVSRIGGLSSEEFLNIGANL